MTLNQKLCKLLSEHLKFGGVTITPRGELITEGIAVAVSKYTEHKVPFTSKAHVELYIKQWLDTTSGSNAIGFWVDTEDNDTVYLDEVRVFKSTELKKAVLWAIQQDQLAVQLLHPNVTLRIEH